MQQGNSYDNNELRSTKVNIPCISESLSHFPPSPQRSQASTMNSPLHRPPVLPLNTTSPTSNSTLSHPPPPHAPSFPDPPTSTNPSCPSGSSQNSTRAPSATTSATNAAPTPGCRPSRSQQRLTPQLRPRNRLRDRGSGSSPRGFVLSVSCAHCRRRALVMGGALASI